jgi:hypothetical protein
MSQQSDATNAILRQAGVIDAQEGAATATAEEQKTNGLPPIRLPGRNVTIGHFARELGAVMCKNGVFLRSDVPVMLDKQRCRLKKLEGKEFRSYVDDHAFLHTLEKSGEEFVKIRQSMKKDIASDTLAAPAFLTQQREIWRVNSVPLPILRADGRLELLEQGFDYESQILTLPSQMTYRVMPVEEARAYFVNLTRGFPMPERDEKTGLSHALAVHIAAMLTPFVMAMLPRHALLPMFLYCANKQGSGKSLLAKMALYAIFGTAASIPFGKDEEELRKLLDTEALGNSPFLFFDNVKRALSSSLLDMWLTQATWKGRRMGGQMGFEVPKQGVVYISSNHAETDKDSTRRSLFCELFTEDADISGRTFDMLLDDSYLTQEEVRCDILSALWSLVVHWDSVGRPSGSSSLSSFERWAALVGGITEAAGFGNPLAKQETITAGDTDTRDMTQLVEIMARRLVERLENERAARESEDADSPVVEEESQPTAEFDFEEVIEICQEKDLFVKRIDGKRITDKETKETSFELTRSSRIGMGKLFQKESGQVWNVPGIGRVRFGRRGSKNWRSFFVDLLTE